MLFDLFLSQWLDALLVLIGYVSSGSAFPKPLSKADEEKYLRLYLENGDESAKNLLIEHNLRLVAHIAKKYADDKNNEDLISIGTIGLIKGINTFNSDKAKKLSSYIARCAENEILMYLRATKRLSNELSMDESIGSDKDGNAMTIADVLTDTAEPIPDLIVRRLDTAALYRAMREVLTEEECSILYRRYGLNHSKRFTQQEIADSLGISRSYVSRIEKRCIKKLAEFMKG